MSVCTYMRHNFYFGVTQKSQGWQDLVFGSRKVSALKQFNYLRFYNMAT